jgi:hypothetical protein
MWQQLKDGAEGRGGCLGEKWYFKFQLVLQIPIGIYFECRLVLWVPIGTSTTNWYFNYQLVLRIPIGTSTTNWYFKYHEWWSINNKTNKNKVDIRAALKGDTAASFFGEWQKSYIFKFLALFCELGLKMLGPQQCSGSFCMLRKMTR